jgi:NADPH2:quinone reductase
VITTAGSPEKVTACLELGASRAINYKTEDVDAEIRKAAPDGVNIYWETLREPNLERAVPLLSFRGRMIVMAGREAKPIFPLGSFYTRDCALYGFAMFNSSPDEQRAAALDLNRMMAEGKLRPRIDRVLPLSEAAEAHKLQEDNTLHKAGTLSGKIVLTP